MALDTIVDLYLRPMCVDDIATVTEWFWNFEDTALFERNLPVPISVQAVQENWRSALEFADPPRACWFMAEDSRCCAQAIAGLQTINYIHGDAVLPFFVAEPMRRRGLATAMAIAMLDVAFDRLRLHRVTTFHRSDHSATGQILCNLGFKEEGRRREGWFADGNRYDTVQTGILGAQWLESRVEFKEAFVKTATVDLHLHSLKNQEDQVTIVGA